MNNDKIVILGWSNPLRSLLPFWALNLVIVLPCMQGQKTLGLHQNILICVPKTNEGLTGLEGHEAE